MASHAYEQWTRTLDDQIPLRVKDYRRDIEPVIEDALWAAFKNRPSWRYSLRETIALNHFHPLPPQGLICNLCGDHIALDRERYTNLQNEVSHERRTHWKEVRTLFTDPRGVSFDHPNEDAWTDRKERIADKARGFADKWVKSRMNKKQEFFRFGDLVDAIRQEYEHCVDQLFHVDVHLVHHTCNNEDGRTIAARLDKPPRR